jgi:predicted transposase YbfD/YdcC
VAVNDLKEGTERSEFTAGLALLESLQALDGKMTTADPLHCQRKVARTIVDKGGDYLLQIKAHRKRLFRQGQQIEALADTAFLSIPKPATDESKSVPCTPSPSNP